MKNQTNLEDSLKKISNKADDLFTGVSGHEYREKETLAKRAKKSIIYKRRKAWETATQKSTEGHVAELIGQGKLKFVNNEDNELSILALPGTNGANGYYVGLPHDSGFLVNLDGHLILFDINSISADLDLERYDKITQIVSHNHTDHLPDYFLRSFLSDNLDEFDLLGTENISKNLNGDSFSIRKANGGVRAEPKSDPDYRGLFRLKHTPPDRLTNSYVFEKNNRAVVFASDGGFTNESRIEYRNIVENLNAETTYVLTTNRGFMRTGEKAKVEETYGNIHHILDLVEPLNSKEIYVVMNHMPFEELLTIEDLNAEEIYSQFKKEFNEYGNLSHEIKYLFELIDAYAVLEVAKHLGGKIETNARNSYTIKNENKTITITRALSPVLIESQGYSEIDGTIYEPWMFNQATNI